MSKQMERASLIYDTVRAMFPGRTDFTRVVGGFWGPIEPFANIKHDEGTCKAPYYRLRKNGVRIHAYACDHHVLYAVMPGR